MTEHSLLVRGAKPQIWIPFIFIAALAGCSGRIGGSDPSFSSCSDPLGDGCGDTTSSLALRDMGCTRGSATCIEQPPGLSRRAEDDVAAEADAVDSTAASGSGQQEEDSVDASSGEEPAADATAAEADPPTAPTEDDATTVAEAPLDDSSTAPSDATEAPVDETPSLCGNGVIDPGEACDDGINDGGEGGCSADCRAMTTACGTPFEWWPGVCRDDLPDAMSGFREPEAPSFYGQTVSIGDASELGSVPDGSRVTVVANPNGTLFMQGNDLEVVIADGVAAGRVIFDNCHRCVLRGGGPNARASYVFSAASEDIVIDSLMIRANSTYANLAVDLHTSSRVAMISTVFHSPYSAAMYTSEIEGLLIAGSSWSSTGAGGINDWGSRLSYTNDVVIVDSQVEARGPQPVLRRAGESSRHFYLRTTTINLHYPESTFDLGSDWADAYDHMYQRDMTYYISNLSNSQIWRVRYGGTPDDDQSRGIYEVENATWFTPDSSDPSYLDAAMLSSRQSTSWQYLLGAPAFQNTLTGSYTDRHPGWPTRGSRFLGQPLAISNPYQL